MYEHVTGEQRQTKEEYSFEFEDTYNEEKNHAVVDFTCRAGRTRQNEKSNSFANYHSSSTWILLLEWILPHFFNYTLFVLYFFNSTKVRRTIQFKKPK